MASNVSQPREERNGASCFSPNRKWIKLIRYNSKNVAKHTSQGDWNHMDNFQPNYFEFPRKHQLENAKAKNGDGH